jgi:hypothetical protein
MIIAATPENRFTGAERLASTHFLLGTHQGEGLRRARAATGHMWGPSPI